MGKIDLWGGVRLKPMVEGSNRKVSASPVICNAKGGGDFVEILDQVVPCKNRPAPIRVDAMDHAELPSLDFHVQVSGCRRSCCPAALTWPTTARFHGGV